MGCGSGTGLDGVDRKDWSFCDGLELAVEWKGTEDVEAVRLCFDHVG